MIAVTGANGYIGRAMVAELVQRGLPVTAVSRASGEANAETRVNWRSTGSDFPSAAIFAGCDTVIHLAGRAHTATATSQGSNLFDLANRQLAMATVSAASIAGVKRFVFVSTLGVHGSGADIALNGSSPVRPAAPYAASKWAAEQELNLWCAANGMSLCIVRPPMVYGKRCPGNFMRLVKIVHLGLPLPFGALHAQRSFIFVDNLTSFLAECATKPAIGTYLVSDASDWSVVELVHKIGSELGKPVWTFPVPKALFRFAGRLLGKRREVDSLTLPMRIDPEPAYRAFAWKPPVAPDLALSLSVRDYVLSG